MDFCAICAVASIRRLEGNGTKKYRPWMVIGSISRPECPQSINAGSGARIYFDCMYRFIDPFFLPQFSIHPSRWNCWKINQRMKFLKCCPVKVGCGLAPTIYKLDIPFASGNWFFIFPKRWANTHRMDLKGIVLFNVSLKNFYPHPVQQ